MDTEDHYTYTFLKRGYFVQNLIEGIRCTWKHVGERISTLESLEEKYCITETAQLVARQDG